MSQGLAALIAKDEISELALLYARGVDRKDGRLLRSLYTRDGIVRQDESYAGDAAGHVDFLERHFADILYGGHHLCNHLISVDGDQGEGEVYAIACHVLPDGEGGFVESFACLRYIDRYRKEEGRWRFAERVVHHDYRALRPLDETPQPMPAPDADPSATVLKSRLFARGRRD